MDHARLEGRVVGFPVDKELVLDMATLTPIKCTQPLNHVPLGTVKHFVDEAARIQFRKSAWRFKNGRSVLFLVVRGGERPVLFLAPSSQFCSWLRAAHR